MNFLGHLYFSGDRHDLMYANLFGDFVKGSDLSSYPPPIRKGIVLHRRIDQYIDHHPSVEELMHKLYPFLPKVSGIAIDLYFDHLLAKRWTEFHPLGYREFLDSFYNYPVNIEDGYSQEFIKFLTQLKLNDWMIHYASREGLGKMCIGVGSRLSFTNALQFAPEVYDRMKDDIEKSFNSYMRDAIPHFKQLIDSLDNELSA